MTVENDDRRKLLNYLSTTLDSGEEVYLRARDIASDLDLSSKQVGKFLGEHDNGQEGIEVEKWGRYRSTRWRILKRDGGGKGC